MLPPEAVVSQPDPDFRKPEFSLAQLAAADTLRATVTQEGYTVTLLDGVTGSGKRKCTLEAVAENIRLKRQTLILMPEIALTAQFLSTVFPAVSAPGRQNGTRSFHHANALAHGRRLRRTRCQWSSVRDPRCSCPTPTSGLLSSMKSTIPLTSRKMGHTITRATWRWCVGRSRKFRWCSLPRRLRSIWKSTRVADASGMCICLSASVVHVCRRSSRSICAARGHRAGASSRRGLPRQSRSLTRGEQALLFLNRRGYAPLTLCRACGFRLQCPNCDAWLVDHRFKRRLVCHHCGFNMPPPAECPNCHATESFAAVGPGVWERLEQGGGRTVSASADPGAFERSGQLVERCGKSSTMWQQDASISIIGTQLVAKGHHFPKLNLVGIVDADLSRAMAIHARPNVHFSCCIRLSAAPAARRAWRRLPGTAAPA